MEKRDLLSLPPKYVNIDATVYLRTQRGWELSGICKNLSNQFMVRSAARSMHRRPVRAPARRTACSPTSEAM